MAVPVWLEDGLMLDMLQSGDSSLGRYLQLQAPQTASARSVPYLSSLLEYSAGAKHTQKRRRFEPCPLWTCQSAWDQKLSQLFDTRQDTEGMSGFTETCRQLQG